MTKLVDEKSVFRFPSVNPFVKGGTDIYDKSRNLLVGLNKQGEISTVHTVTKPSKLQGILKQIKKISNDRK